MFVRSRRAAAWWGGFLALGLGMALSQPTAAAGPQSGPALDNSVKAQVDALQDAVRALQDQLQALGAQVTALQGETTAGLAALQSELDALSQRVTVLESLVGGPPPPSPRFVDNGDGTVTDTQSGLTWEQKVVGGDCLHCVNDAYPWALAVGDWIDRLNGRLIGTPSELPFAGHTDWRLPTLAELQTILLLPSCTANPCIDPVFGPTLMAGYWTASTLAGSPTSAWDVFFTNGFVNFNPKATGLAVRAVRGGRP